MLIERLYINMECVCVWMSEVSKVVGNGGRCVSLLFAGSLQSDFSPIEPV